MPVQVTARMGRLEKRSLDQELAVKREKWWRWQLFPWNAGTQGSHQEREPGERTRHPCNGLRDYRASDLLGICPLVDNREQLSAVAPVFVVVAGTARDVSLPLVHIVTVMRRSVAGDLAVLDCGVA